MSQYPDIVPPTVTVNATYPGADAETVASTVAAPIEQEINGVDNMLYMSSQSTGDGNVTITVTFKQGTDLNAAQVLVQNRVAIAMPRLPEEVQRLGVVTRKTSPDFLMVVNLVSPEQLARSRLHRPITRSPRCATGSPGSTASATCDCSALATMRCGSGSIPNRAAALDLTAGEIVDALRAQNVQVAAGTLGQPPYATRQRVPAQRRDAGTPDRPPAVRQRRHPHRCRTAGRCACRTSPESSSAPRIIASNTYLSGEPTVHPRRLPASRLERAGRGRRGEGGDGDAVARTSRQGLNTAIIYNPTEFISQSIDAVMHTLLEAIALVVLVVIVFLQSWRAAIIPVVAIPGIADRHVRGAAGGRLFAQQPLAVRAGAGDRHRRRRRDRRGRECRAKPRARAVAGLEAARTSMDEVGAALIAIVLVLCAVFVPTLFLNGLSGAFYHQFAVTISAATVISLLISLTLSPALAALLLQAASRGQAAAMR